MKKLIEYRVSNGLQRIATDCNGLQRIATYLFANVPIAVFLLLSFGFGRVCNAQVSCQKPDHLRATVVSDTTATMNWTPVPGALSYQLIYKPAHDDGAFWTTKLSSGSSTQLTGLIPITLYKAQIRTVCSGTFSSYSEEVYFSTGPYFSPKYPFVGSVAATSASLLWIGLNDVSQYQVEHRIQGTSTWSASTSSSTIYQLAGLEVNKTYEVRLRSEYPGYNYSDYSQTVIFATGPCSTPDSLHVQHTGATTATLAWKTEPVATSYTLAYRVFGTSIWSIETTSFPSIALSGLSTSTLYQYRVRAQCDTAVFSAWSSIQLFATGSCSTPENLIVSDVLYTNARLSWNNSSNAQGYRLLYQRHTQSSWDTVNIYLNEYTIQGLESGTVYRFKIQAYCGSSTYSPFTADNLFHTKTCATPDSVVADTIGHGYAHIRWADAAIPKSSLYCIDYRIVGTDNWNRQITPNEFVSLDYLSTGVNYELVVYSLCDTNYFSVGSDTLVFSTTLCPQPDSSWVTNISYSTAWLNWNAVGVAQQYEIILSPIGSSGWDRFETADTSFRINELRQGQGWQWRVSSLCGSKGRSSVSLVDTFTTNYCNEPDTLTVGNAGYTSVQLNWSSVDLAETYAIDYREISSSSVGTWQRIYSSDTFTSIASLKSSMTYAVRVYSRCDATTYSATSRTYEFETDECSKPGAFMAERDGYAALSAHWTPVSGSQGYEFRWRHIDSLSWTSIFVQDTFASVSSLYAGGSYQTSVRSACDTILGAWSQWHSADPVMLPLCGSDLGLRFLSSGSDSLSLLWSSHITVHGYRLRWRSQGDTIWNEIAVSDTQYVATGLTSCTIYEFKLQTRCDTVEEAESDWSLSHYVTTKGSGCWNEPLPMALEYDPVYDGWPTDAWSLNDAELSPETRWIDRYGHERVPIDLSLAAPDTCGVFKVYYAEVLENLTMGFGDTVSITTHTSGATTRGQLRRNCLCQALTDVGQVISDSERMPEIYVRRSLDVGTGALGSGSSFYEVGSSEAFQGGSVRDILVSGVDSVSGYDAWLRFDFADRDRDTVVSRLHANWYAPPGTDIDFYSIAQHQVYKLLGFASLFHPEGTSLTRSSSYSLLDRNWHYLDLADTAYKPLLSEVGSLNLNFQEDRYAPVIYYIPSSESIKYPLSCAPFIRYHGGSSLSILKELNYNYVSQELMTVYSKIGLQNKILSESEKDVLRDLGYTVRTIGGGNNNRQPVAVRDAVSIKPTEQAQINLLLNDYDPDGQEVRFAPSFQPRIVRGRGLLECQSNGACIVKPTPGFEGDIEIAYRTFDGYRNGGFGSAVVTVRANKTSQDMGCGWCVPRNLFDEFGLNSDGGFDDYDCRLRDLHQHGSDLRYYQCQLNDAIRLGEFSHLSYITAYHHSNWPHSYENIPNDGRTYPKNNTQRRYFHPQNQNFAAHHIRGNNYRGQKSLVSDPGPKLDEQRNPIRDTSTSTYGTNYNWRMVLWRKQVSLTPGRTYCFRADVANINGSDSNAPPNAFLAITQGLSGFRPDRIYHANGFRPQDGQDFQNNSNAFANQNLISTVGSGYARSIEYQDGWRTINATFTPTQDGFYNFYIILDRIPNHERFMDFFTDGTDVAIDGVILEDTEDDNRQPAIPDRIEVHYDGREWLINQNSQRYEVCGVLSGTLGPNGPNPTSPYVDLLGIFGREIRSFPDGIQGNIDVEWSLRNVVNPNTPIIVELASNNTRIASLFLRSTVQNPTVVGPIDCSVCMRIRKRTVGTLQTRCPWSDEVCINLRLLQEIPVILDNPLRAFCNQPSGEVSVIIPRSFISQGPVNQQYTITLFNSNGQQIQQVTLIASNNPAQALLHVFVNLPAGLYTVTVTLNNVPSACPYQGTVLVRTSGTSFSIVNITPISACLNNIARFSITLNRLNSPQHQFPYIFRISRLNPLTGQLVQIEPTFSINNNDNQYNSTNQTITIDDLPATLDFNQLFGVFNVEVQSDGCIENALFNVNRSNVAVNILQVVQPTACNAPPGTGAITFSIDVNSGIFIRTGNPPFVIGGVQAILFHEETQSQTVLNITQMQVIGNNIVGQFNGLIPGYYRIQVVDLGVEPACSTAVFSVMRIHRAPANLQIEVNTQCMTQSSGPATLQAQVFGGTPPYTYAWISVGTTDPPQQGNGQSFTVNPNIPGGTYSLTVTDANGCVNELNPINVARISIFNRDENGRIPNAELIYVFCQDLDCNNPNCIWGQLSLAGGHFNLQGLALQDLVAYAIVPVGQELQPANWQDMNINEGQDYIVVFAGNPFGLYQVFFRTADGCVESAWVEYPSWIALQQVDLIQPSCANTTGQVVFRSPILNAMNLNQYDYSFDNGATWFGLGDQGSPFQQDLRPQGNQNHILVTGLAPSTYNFRVRLSTQHNCTSSALEVIILPNTDDLACGTIPETVNVCFGNSLILNGGGFLSANIFDYIDLNTGSLVGSGIPIDDLFVGGNGNLTYGNLTLLQSPAGAPNPQGLTSIDENGNFIFNPDDANPLINPVLTDPDANAMQPGIYQYQITATDEGGCTHACTLTVNLQPRPVVSAVSEMFNPNFDCANNQTGVVLVNAFAPDADPLRYSLNNGAFLPANGQFNPWMLDQLQVPSLNSLRIENLNTGCLTIFRFELGIDPTRQPDVSFINPTCQRLDPHNEDGSITVSDPFALSAHLRGAGFQHNTSPDLQFGLALDPATPTNWFNGGQTGQVPFRNLTARRYNVQMRIEANNTTCTSAVRQVALVYETSVSVESIIGDNGTITASNCSGGTPPFTIRVFDDSDVELTSEPYQSTVNGGSLDFGGGTLPPGLYTVAITNADGCIFSTTQTFSGLRQGDQGRPETASYRLYPNPTRGLVTVEFDAPAGAGQIFEVQDLTGRLIGRWELTEGSRSLQIETTGWAESLYACTLRHGKRVLFVSKLSVIR